MHGAQRGAQREGGSCIGAARDERASACAGRAGNWSWHARDSRARQLTPCSLWWYFVGSQLC